MVEAFVYTTSDLEDFGNRVKDILLEALVKEVAITEEAYMELSKNYFVHLKKPSSLSQFFKKLVGKNKKEDYIIVIGRFCNRHNIEVEEEADREA